MSQYQPLFRLEIKHGYFAGGWPKGLHVHPQGLAETLLAKQVLAIRMEEMGFSAFVNGKVSNLISYWQKVYAMGALEFELTTADWAFPFYTEQPLDWIGTRIYDSADADGSGLMRETPGPLSSPPVLGKIRIELSDIAQSVKTYSIEFAARATQWQYYIINRSALSMEAPGIKGFSGPEKVVTESGEAALFFSSGSSMIALSQRPDIRFDLVDGHSASIIWKGLPLPDPAWTKKVDIGGQTKACSPMYVYV
jgi:hypothetical protein